MYVTLSNTAYDKMKFLSAKIGVVIKTISVGETACTNHARSN